MKGSPRNKLRILGVEDVRHTNELKLLHIIRERQPISRIDLVRDTGLRAGTVSLIVNRLLRAAVIHAGEMAPSSGGRPATYLKINADRAHVIGISIGVHDTVYGVSDFNGKILNQQSVRTERDGSAFVAALGKKIAAQLRTTPKHQRPVSVGVSVPGLIDRAGGMVVRSPNLGWSDVRIASILERQLQLPVHVENDANAAALSELWYGPMEAWSAHCLLFVLIVEGIGTGLILDGEVYIGSQIGMGGFGHIPLDPAGPKCSCGSTGCLETLASNEATLARYAALHKRHRDSSKTIRELCELAITGDSRARDALTISARHLGRGLKGLAHGLAPEVIVIGGEIARAWPVIEPTLQEEMKGAYLLPGLSLPQLRPATSDNPPFSGAFPIALRSILHALPARAAVGASQTD